MEIKTLEQGALAMIDALSNKNIELRKRIAVIREGWRRDRADLKYLLNHIRLVECDGHYWYELKREGHKTEDRTPEDYARIESILKKNDIHLEAE